MHDKPLIWIFLVPNLPFCLNDSTNLHITGFFYLIVGVILDHSRALLSFGESTGRYGLDGVCVCNRFVCVLY